MSPYDPLHDAPTQPLPARTSAEQQALPARTGAEQEAASDVATADALATSDTRSSAANDVVVVDHDPETQTQVARTLTEHGARVVATGSPDAALTLMSQWRAGLVLVSEALPGGLDLARRIRAAHPAAQVVLMTATESPELRASASIAGVLGLLVKPFSLEALFDLLDLSATLSPAE